MSTTLVTLGTVIAEGLYASRPAFGMVGRLYFATDTGQTWYDNGTAWVNVTPAAILPSGTANKVIATATSGGSAVSALRALVPADLPVATTGALGVVKPDGSTITISAGVISGVAGFVNPMTTEGDLIYGAGAGTATRLPAGSSGEILQTNGTGSPPSWANVAVSFCTVPLVNGDTPGPAFMADAEGQGIGVFLGAAKADSRIQVYLGAGTYADIPGTVNLSPGAGAVYLATDSGVLYAWTGSAWLDVSS